MNVSTINVFIFISVCALVNGIVLEYRPKPPAWSKTAHSDLIWYKVSNHTDFKIWTDEIKTFLDGYRVPPRNNTVVCDYNTKPAQGQICDLLEPVNKWQPCISENYYGYHRGTPCVFLVLNKTFGWVPEGYNDISNLPKEMPRDLQEHIRSESIKDPKSMNTVWVSCEGDTPADIENIGPIQYLPSRGFPGYYFPLKSSDENLNPVIAIWIEKPAMGIVISVTCKVWAKNINNGGSVHFELLLD